MNLNEEEEEEEYSTVSFCDCEMRYLSLQGGTSLSLLEIKSVSQVSILD